MSLGPATMLQQLAISTARRFELIGKRGHLVEVPTFVDLPGQTDHPRHEPLLGNGHGAKGIAEEIPQDYSLCLPFARRELPVFWSRLIIKGLVETGLLSDLGHVFQLFAAGQFDGLREWLFRFA